MATMKLKLTDYAKLNDIEEHTARRMFHDGLIPNSFQDRNNRIWVNTEGVSSLLYIIGNADLNKYRDKYKPDNVIMDKEDMSMLPSLVSDKTIIKFIMVGSDKVPDLVMRLLESVFEAHNVKFVKL